MRAETLTRRIEEMCRGLGRTGGALATPIPGLTLLRMAESRVLAHQIYDPVFCLVLQGAKLLWSGERQVTCAARQGLVVAVDLPVISRVVDATPARPYVAVALRLSPDLLAEMAAAAPPAPRLPAATSAIAVEACDDLLLDAVDRLVALADEPQARAVLAPLVLREVHFRLLQSVHGPRLAQIARTGGTSHRIAQAAALLRRDFAQTLRVEAVARAAGMSVSAFHAHFRALTGTTPVQFQKSLRLIEAQRLLQGGRHGVAGAAFAVGYESPTQFSRDYARRFGRPPRDDLPRGALRLAG